MSRKISSDEYADGLAKLALLVPLILETDFEAMAELQSHAEAITPLVDPTLWIKKGEAFELDKRATQAFVDLKAQLKKIYHRKEAAAC